MLGLGTYNPLWLVPFAVTLFAGLGYLTSALFAARGSTLYRDRGVVGMCLLGTAVVFLLAYLLSFQGDALFSDAATSVSNAPRP